VAASTGLEDAMSAVFGPNTRRVLRFFAHIPDLAPEQLDRAADLWKQTSSQKRAECWAEVSRTTTDEERSRILVAAHVARRAALDVAHRHHHTDWAFWAAVWDATGAIAAGDRLGGCYDILVRPLAAVLPSLTAGRDDALHGRHPQEAVLGGEGLL
jgi:hypothetical protein